MPTAVALVVFGTVMTGAATAYTRPAAILDRYAAFSACGPIALYLWFVAAAPAAALFWLNEPLGMRDAHAFRYASDDTLRDLNAGDPPMVLGGRYGGILNVMRPSLAEDLEACRRPGFPHSPG